MVGIKPWKKNGKEGWEVDIRGTLPNGEPYRDRKKSPVAGKSASLRWAQQREAEIIAQGGREPRPLKAGVPTVEACSLEFLTYSKTNNKPSTVAAMEWMLRVHLLPCFGRTRLDQLGPADIEAYKAKKLDEGLNRKSINNT